MKSLVLTLLLPSVKLQGTSISFSRLVSAAVSRLDCSTHTVLDLGCGFGDSLLLWKDEFKVENVIGVNITESECIEAVRKLSLGDKKFIRVLCADAVSFVKRGVPNEDVIHVDRAVVVDSLYHFNTRKELLHALSKTGRVRLVQGGRFAALDMFGTVDLCKSCSKGNNDVSYMEALRHPFSFLCAKFVSSAAGVPLKNLIYTEESMRGWVKTAGYEEYKSIDVTAEVLEPFANYAWNEGIEYSKDKGIAKCLTLLSSSYFIRFLSWSGVVRVHLYSMSKK